MIDMELRNCEFAFRCNAQWEDLLQTAKEKVRFCLQCGKGVHRCDTDAELLRAIRQDHCVAITKPADGQFDGVRFLVGSPRARF